MRILFDGYPLLTTKSGVGYYTYNLIGSLLKLDHENDYTILYNTSKSRKEPIVMVPERYLRYPYKAFNRFPFIPSWLKNIPLESFVGEFDIFHGTNAGLLPVKEGATVLTIHDLAYVHYPETIGRSSYKFLTKNLARYAQLCDRIVTVSDNTKRDIIECLNIDPKKINVTHLAADARYRPIDRNDAGCKLVQAKYKLPERFILYVGNLEPRKNIPALIRSYSMMIKRTGGDHKLVLAGGCKRGFEEIMSLIRQLKIEDKVILTGYVELEDIPYLYNLAEVFAYVSKFEGFGLPPLEAMQCGIPVIVSSVSSLPEVVGDAGIMVDPFDDKKISIELEKMIADDKLRKYYSQKGRERAAEFSWEKTAIATMAAYKKAFQSKNG